VNVNRRVHQGVPGIDVGHSPSDADGVVRLPRPAWPKSVVLPPMSASTTGPSHRPSPWRTGAGFNRTPTRLHRHLAHVQNGWIESFTGDSATST